MGVNDAVLWLCFYGDLCPLQLRLPEKSPNPTWAIIVVGSVSLITFWLCIPHMFNEMSSQLLLQCLAFSALVAAWFDNRNMPSRQQEHGMIHFCFQSRFAKSALVDFLNPNAEEDPLHQRFFETQLLDLHNNTTFFSFFCNRLVFPNPPYLSSHHINLQHPTLDQPSPTQPQT